MGDKDGVAIVRHMLDRLGKAGRGRPAQKLNRCSALVGVVIESAAPKFDNRLNAVVRVDQSRLQSPSPTLALIRLRDASGYNLRALPRFKGG
jgi:hypothetical protein